MVYPAENKVIETSQLNTNMRSSPFYHEVMSSGRETSIPISAAYFLAHFLVRIEAKGLLAQAALSVGSVLTFEEPLACIFLEEGFMGDWASQIVDHESEDRLNFFLAVPGIMSKGCVLT